LSVVEERSEHVLSSVFSFERSVDRGLQVVHLMGNKVRLALRNQTVSSVVMWRGQSEK